MWEPNLEKLSLEEFKKRYGEEMAKLVDDSYDEEAIYYAHKEKENALALMWYYQIRNTVIYEEYNGIERYEDLSSNDKPDLRIEIKIE